MRKESQRELVQEAWQDIVRSVAVAAKKIDPQISSAIDTLYRPIKTVKTAFEKQNPKSTLMAALKNNYYRTFDYKSINVGKEQKLPGDDKSDNRVAIPFTARLIKKVSGKTTTVTLSTGTTVTGGLSGGKEAQDQFTAVLSRDKKGLSGEYKLNIIRDSTGRPIMPDNTSGQRSLSASLSSSPPSPSGTKPKFTQALRDWKTNNIGPSGATVGINYQQAKAFLQSLNVPDPDRVLSQAGIQDNGSQIISNKNLATVEFTLKSRNIVECTQLDTLQHFQILFLDRDS